MWFANYVYKFLHIFDKKPIFVYYFCDKNIQEFSKIFDYLLT